MSPGVLEDGELNTSRPRAPAAMKADCAMGCLARPTGGCVCTVLPSTCQGTAVSSRGPSSSRDIFKKKKNQIAPQTAEGGTVFQQLKGGCREDGGSDRTRSNRHKLLQGNIHSSIRQNSSS